MFKGLLKNKGYLTLMLAQAISSIGDWLSIVAVITLVGLKWHASPIEVSLIFLCLAIPMAVLGPIAGVVADRSNQKSLMITSDLVRAGLILILTVADTLFIVYICLFMVGAFSSIFIPAKNGKLKEMVDDEHMKSAMSISSMIDSGTKVVGPLISGILVSTLGTSPVFYIDSATFILSALIIFFLPKTVKPLNEKIAHAKNMKSSFRKEFTMGLTFMKDHTFLLAGMVFLGVSLLLIQFADSQLIVLIRELTAASPDLFGYLVTASGLGMFLSGLLLVKLTNYNPFSLMVIGVFGLGLSFGAMVVLTYFDVSFSVVWMTSLGFWAGFSASLVFIPYHASVQVDTPAHMTGRVFGVINSVATTATIIGPLLGGWLSTIIGVIPAFIISASLLVLLSLIGALNKHKIIKKDDSDMFT